MTRDVRALNRAQKLNLIKLTMLALQAKLYYLQENYNRYYENYSDEAMQLYNASFRFDSAVNNLVQSEGMDRLDDNGLTAMAELSLQVSELYKLGLRTPDDQKEYEATIKQFKEDVYTEALKRLEANKKETNVYETDLLAEAKSKGGKNLSPIYEYYDLQKQIDKNQYQIDYAGMMGNSDDYSKYYAVNKELKYKAKVIKENTPLLSHLPYEETIVKDIRNLCNKIRNAQGKVEKLLNKGKYPIWELNPVIAHIFETNEFYTPDKQEYIFDWIKEQERIDQLVDVFKNAIPIALSVMCFFMPGGVSIAMLILQGANAVASAAAAYDDIQDAGAVRNMAYSQYPVSEEAQKIIDNADLSAIERNYAMAILSGAFTMLDFAECVKIARKLGIGDEVMKYFAQGRKFRLSVDETEELVRKAKSAIDDISVRTVNVDSVSQKYLENLNKKSINKLTRREDGYEILKKYEAYFGDNVEFVNELIENTPGKEIYVEPEKLILNYLSKNKINVDSINIKQIINKNTNFNELKKTIDLINSNVKDIDPSLLKSVPLDTTVNKQTGYMKELNAILEKKGITLERYKQIVLRNIDDTSNLPPEGSEELKQIAETIRSIREEVIGKMNKDVEFRKYITQQDLIKYLNGEKNTITGFIARECDANILDNYNEIFNSFRLDYPNTDYNPKVDNFIAYVKFKVKEAGEIDKIEIPYSPKFGGTNTYDKAPCSGTGILNSKNGLIIPELKVKYREKIELLDGAELHIQTRDGKDILIGVFSDERFIPQGE